MAQVLGVKDGSLAATIELERQGSTTIPKKTFSLIYTVLSASPYETEDDIIDAPGIPPRWYPINGAVCVAHDANQIETVRNPMTGAICDIWEVTVYFDTRAVPDDCEDDVICKRPKVRWYGETVDEVMDFEPGGGRDIVTRAGEKIIVTKPTTIIVLEIKRYEPAPYDPLVLFSYSNRLNAAPFYGAPVGSAWMSPPESEEEVINNVTYCACTYTIRFKLSDYSVLKFLEDEDADRFSERNKNSWAFAALHQGYMYRKVAGGKPQIAVDKQGQPMTVNLDKDGKILAAGEKPQYLSFLRHYFIDFNNLSLGPF